MRRYFFTRKLVFVVPAAFFVFLLASRTHAAGFSPDTSSTLTNNLISYYKLDDATDSFGTSTLTEYNSPSYATSTCKKPNCGTQGTGNTNKHWRAATNLGIDGGAITISAWFRPNSINNGDNIFAYQGNDNSDVDYYLDYNQSNGKLVFGRDNHGHGATEVGETITLSTSTWYYVAGTYDGTTLKYYRDGLLTASSTATGTGTGVVLDQIAIGSYENGTNIASGMIDEVGYWNRALNSTEISDLYNSSTGNTYTVPSSIPSISSLSQFLSDVPQQH